MSDDLRERIAEAIVAHFHAPDEKHSTWWLGWADAADAVLAVVQPELDGLRGLDLPGHIRMENRQLWDRAERADAEVARLRAFIAAELDGICLNGEGAFEAFDRRDRHIAALRTPDGGSDV